MPSLPELQGTLLTEGRGVGRGTRFATPLSTRQLVTGRREQGITGGKGGISGEAALNLNPAGAMVRPRSVDAIQVKPLVTEGSGVSPAAMVEVGNILSRATFNYADRVSSAKADEAVIAFNERARTMFFGDAEQGSQGFHGLRGVSAVEARGDFFKSVDQALAETLDSLDPDVKQKALGKLHSIRDTTLNRAASHIVQEQNNYETQVKAAKANDIARELAVDYNDPEGLKIEFAGAYGEDVAQANKDWDSAVVTAANNHYRNILKRDGYDKSLPALRDYIDKVSPTLTEKGRDILEDYFDAEEKQEEVAKNKIEIENKKLEAEAMANSALDLIQRFDGKEVAIHTISDVIAASPGLAGDLNMAKAVLSYADSRRAKSSADSVDRYNAAFSEVVQPMLATGEVFPDKASLFVHLQEAYGNIKPAQVNALWAYMSEPIKQDEKLLATQVRDLDRRLRNAFGVPDAPPQPPVGGSDADWAAWTAETMAYKKSTNRFPVEYQLIQNTISQISQNKAVPAFEREQQIHDYIANEAKKVGAPPELTQVENIAVLTDYYKVKAHVDKIRNTPDNEITAPTSGDILWPNPLPGTDPRVPSSTSGQGEMMRSTAPTNSVEISFLSPNGSYDEAQRVKKSVLRKAEANGILDVKFVINHQIGGVSHTGYIGRVRQEDGSYVLQALNLQPVKGK